MSTPTVTQQSPVSITVEFHNVAVNGSSSKLKAFADVTLVFAELGLIKISGFSIFQGDENQLPRVSPPARKGKGDGSPYYPTVTLMGMLQRLVHEAVLTEYAAQVRGQAGTESGKGIRSVDAPNYARQKSGV